MNAQPSKPHKKLFKKALKRLKRLIIVTGFILLISALIIGVSRISIEVLNARFLQQITADLTPHLPQLSEENHKNTVSPNLNQKLNALALENQDWVGILEIPSLNLRLPVATQRNPTYTHAAPYVYSGSPYKKTFIIGAENYQSQFFHLTSLTDNAQIIFTDLLGQTFTYRVKGIGDIPRNADHLLRAKTEPWDLTLYTDSLSTYQRIIIRCTQE